MTMEPERASDQTGKAGPSGRVLVAEDNPTNQRLISAFLKSLGVDHVIAENGQEVIDLLVDDVYAVILMDIQMPVLDGMSAMRLIRSGATPQQDVPIIVVTANAMQGDRDTYLNAGADDYLAKPITLDALKNALEPFGVLQKAQTR